MKNPRSADDEDFNSAAESLLGIDLSSSGLSAAPIDLDDADLFGEPDVVEPEPAQPSEPEPDETQELRPAPAPAAFDDDDFGDFGAGLIAEEPPRPARVEPRPVSRAPERPAPRAEDRPARRVEERPAPRAEERPAAFAEELAPAGEPPAGRAPAAPKDDAYWDALEGWDWSEETSGSSKSAAKEDAPPPRGRSSDRSRGRSGGDRQKRRSDEPARRSEEQPRRSDPPASERPRARPPVDALDDDFGSGLEGSPPPRGGRPSKDASVFPLHPSESQARQIRGRDRSESETEASIFGLDPTESQARDLDDRDIAPRRPQAPPRVEFAEGDDFGMGLDEAADAPREFEAERGVSEQRRESSEGEPRRGRRRRGRGRGQSQEGGQRVQSRPPVEARQHEPEVRDDLSFDEAVDELPSREEPVDDDVQEPRFVDVPTWAEAIDLLVKSRPRTSSGSGDRGRSEGSSDSGDRGGNGGRGRGRGRRGGGGRRSN